MLNTNKDDNELEQFIPVLSDNFIKDHLPKVETYLHKYLAHNLVDDSLLPYDRTTFKTYLAFDYQGNLVIGGEHQHELKNNAYKLFGYNYLSIKRNRRSIHSWATDILKTYQAQQIKQAVIQQQMSLSEINKLAEHNSYNLCFTPQAYAELIAQKIDFIDSDDINENYLQAGDEYFATILLRKQIANRSISIKTYLIILDYVFLNYLDNYAIKPKPEIKQLVECLCELIWQDNFSDANTNEISSNNFTTLARISAWAGLKTIKIPLHYLTFLKHQFDILSFMPFMPSSSIVFTLKNKDDLKQLIKIFNNQDWAKQFLVMLLNATCKFKINLITKANNEFLIDHIKKQYSAEDLAKISKALI